MAKRKQSFSLSEPRLCAPQRRVLRNSGEGREVKQCAKNSFTAGDIRLQVLALIDSCTPGVWLRILPLEEDNDSLCFHTGQEWADVQPCLQECRLVTTPGRFGGKLSAPVREWEHFSAASGGVFEVGTARPNRRTLYIFVMRKPLVREEWMCTRPIEQLHDGLEVQRVSLSPRNHYFRRCRIHLLSKPMEKAIVAINQKPSVCNRTDTASNEASEFVINVAPIDVKIEPNDTDVAPIKIATIEHDAVPIGAPATVTPTEKRRLGIDNDDRLDDLGSTWESAMTKALSLDFAIQPRPSRDGTGKIVALHDRSLAETLWRASRRRALPPGTPGAQHKISSFDRRLW
jgi:hypothetical protein